MIKSIDSYSVEYLSWITAIVVGTITLTTIVFTHYNERAIEKANDFVEKIRSSLYMHKDNKDDLPYNELVNPFNKLIHALSNNHVYKLTLKFFEIILYVLVILWFFGSLGYALNTDTLIEKIFIMVGSFILMGVFIYIPEIIKVFNKNKSLMMTDKNKCSFNEALSFFGYKNVLTKKEIIKNIMNPTLNISINNNHIEIEYNQGLEMVDYFVIFELEKNNEKIYICLDIDNDTQMLKYSTEQNIGQSFEGLFESIKNCSKTKGYIYIFDNNTAEKNVFKLSNTHTEDGIINLSLKDYNNITNISVTRLFERKTSLIKRKSPSPNGDKEYSLTKK
ncbi:hypothetical protein U2I53_14185 [Lysinibacillus capsici]|uniref:hypothetical protein n=1 Tax=Lysinibacillus capsici TaxID=2115968 RepID=UPI0032DEA401